MSCASSTCSLPSRVRARDAKMSRMSCVRSTTFRSSRASICRSCAGVSSLSKMTRSTSVSSQAAASEAILPLPRNVAASGPVALLEHPQHDARAGRRRQAGQLVERALGLGAPHGPGDEADQGRALCAHSASRISENGIGARADQRRHRSLASTIVDGTPPGVGPLSSTRSTSPSSAAAATSARWLAGDPERFALVATTGKPNRRGQRPRHGVVRHPDGHAARSAMHAGDDGRHRIDHQRRAGLARTVRPGGASPP